MKNFISKVTKGFTLVELIVVIAIIAVLSTIGFVSYNGYIRDARNADRNSGVAAAVGEIQGFLANNGRPPKCANTTAPTICELKRAAAADGAGIAGVSQADWDKLNFTKAPVDPRKTTAGADIYYEYAQNGIDFEVSATKEENGYFTAIVKGTKDTSVAANIINTPGVNTPNPPPNPFELCTTSTPNTGGKVVDGKGCLPYTL